MTISYAWCFLSIERDSSTLVLLTTLSSRLAVWRSLMDKVTRVAYAQQSGHARLQRWKLRDLFRFASHCSGGR